MKYSIFYIVSVIIVFFSCNNDKSITNQGKGSSKVYDSIVCKTEVSGVKLRVHISLLKKGKRYEKHRQFVKTGEFYSEQYAIKYFLDEKVDTVFIPAFICKDTSFKSVFDYDKSGIMAPHGFYDWSYNIKRQSDGLFLLKKQNLTDTTWREFFWYDKDFVIKRMRFLNAGDTLNITL